MESVQHRIRRKIAVIGAGMAGLCTLRHFAHDPKYSVVAFEQAGTIAGIWNYPDHAEKYTNEASTSPFYCRIYRDLRTNTPKDLTGFQDFPFPKGEDTYCKREVVLRYYHDYVKHFNLFPFIKLRHKVNLVKPVTRNTSGQVIKWRVEVTDLERQTVLIEEFDNVIVCNGYAFPVVPKIYLKTNFSIDIQELLSKACTRTEMSEDDEHYHKPNVPNLADIKNFKGPVLHSCQYRVPEIFQNKSVLVVGAKSSANDITCEIIPHAKRVVICRRFQASVFEGKYSNVIETTELASFGTDYIILRDGSEVDIDVVLLCTGFMFDMPFLSEDCNVRVSRGRVSPVYRHLIHCENPSMAFVGLPNMIVVTHVVNVQVFYYKAYLDGKVQLPSTKDMLAEEEREIQEKSASGLPEHMAHEMRLSQWPYMNLMAEEAGFPTYEPALKAIYETSGQAARSAPCGFRNFQLEKTDPDHFIYVPLAPSID